MPTMPILAVILLSIEGIIVRFQFGRYSNFFISDQKIFNAIVTFFFVINCIVVISFYLLKIGKKKKRLEIFSTVMLLSVIFLIDMNSSAIEKENKSRMEAKQQIYVKKMGDNLIPFYTGDGTPDQQKVQQLREKFVSYFVIYDAQSSDIMPDICAKADHSFVTSDMNYIILTCEVTNNAFKHYVLPTMNNGKRIDSFYIMSLSSLARYEVNRFPYPELLSTDEFSPLYHDSADDTYYGVYQDKFYQISPPTQTQTTNSSDEPLTSSVNNAIAESIITFQKKHEELFPNNRIIKLANYLIKTYQCSQVHDVFLLDDQYVTIGCDTEYYAFKYQKFSDSSFYSLANPLVINIPFVQDNQSEEYANSIVNACNLSQQIDFSTDRSLDIEKIKITLNECDNDRIYPYYSCIGIYRGELSKAGKVNFFNSWIIHIKDSPTSSRCVLALSDGVAAKISPIFKHQDGVMKLNL